MSQREATEQVRKRIVVESTCDHCGKVEKGQPESWVRFATGHDDWDNDSIESSKWWDACSFPCFRAITRKVFEDYGGYHEHGTLHIYGMDGWDWAFMRSMLSEETP